MLSSSHWLFLVMLSCCGLSSGRLLLQRTRCAGGVLRGIPCARFCFGGQESIAHLFFHCSFCKRVWRHLMTLCLITNPCIEWDDVVNWSYKLKGRSLQVLLCKLCLVAVVYHLWRLRNDFYHGNTSQTEETLVAFFFEQRKTLSLLQ
jgi:hypothetical protein